MNEDPYYYGVVTEAMMREAPSPEVDSDWEGPYMRCPRCFHVYDVTKLGDRAYRTHYVRVHVKH